MFKEMYFKEGHKSQHSCPIELTAWTKHSLITAFSKLFLQTDICRLAQQWVLPVCTWQTVRRDEALLGWQFPHCDHIYCELWQNTSGSHFHIFPVTTMERVLVHSSMTFNVCLKVGIKKKTASASALAVLQINSNFSIQLCVLMSRSLLPISHYWFMKERVNRVLSWNLISPWHKCKMTKSEICDLCTPKVFGLFSIIISRVLYLLKYILNWFCRWWST